MTRKEALRFAFAGAALLATSLTAPRSAEAAPQKAGANDIYLRCAKACEECRKACMACHEHCEKMVKAGAKEHERSMRLSADCRDICAPAAAICARKGPMSAAICEACKAACYACGPECGKHADMAVMKRCQKSCEICSRACQELIDAIKARA